LFRQGPLPRSASPFAHLCWLFAMVFVDDEELFPCLPSAGATPHGKRDQRRSKNKQRASRFARPSERSGRGATRSHGGARIVSLPTPARSGSECQKTIPSPCSSVLGRDEEEEGLPDTASEKSLTRLPCDTSRCEDHICLPDTQEGEGTQIAETEIDERALDKNAVAEQCGSRDPNVFFAEAADDFDHFGPAHRHVHFDFGATCIHEIPRYSEIYGMHPREFDLDKAFSMAPPLGFGETLQQSLMAGIDANADDLDENGLNSDSEEEDSNEDWVFSHRISV